MFGNNTRLKIKMHKIFLGLTLVLSLLAGIIIPLYHERLFGQCEVDITLSENWKRISVQEKLDNLNRLLSKNTVFPLVSEIRQLSIRRQFIKMIADQEDDILKAGRQYRVAFHFSVGWKELALLGLIGFTSVWVIYGSVRALTLLIPIPPLRHFPSPTLEEQVESLHFPGWREPEGLPSVRITLFGFLALEERPKRLKKPAAVWID
jgi:hypothetical protein